jgi:hypothetical protein
MSQIAAASAREAQLTLTCHYDTIDISVRFIINSQIEAIAPGYYISHY